MDAVAAALSLDAEHLNLEGACLVGDALRWFHRGLPSAGLPSGSVDIDLSTALAAVLGHVERKARDRAVDGQFPVSITGGLGAEIDGRSRSGVGGRVSHGGRTGESERQRRQQH